MSPAGDIWPPWGVQVSWYLAGSQLDLAAMAVLPMTAASPVPRVTASSANQDAKALPPPVAVSWANLASRPKRKAVPGESVGSVSGFAAGLASGLTVSWACAAGTANEAVREVRASRGVRASREVRAGRE